MPVFHRFNDLVMANLKASIKDIRRSAKRTEHDRREKSSLKTLRKRVDTVAAAGDAAETRAAASAYISAMDKAAKRHIIHPNKARRQKSAYSRLLKAG